MIESIESVLMRRDGLSREEAREQVQACRQELRERLEQGEMPHDICEEWFGLEPDYLDQLI